MSLQRKFGLYNPENEHDSCGIGFVAHIKGQKSHEIIQRGLEVIINMAHRGAEGADNKTGDGAGITIQIPHDFFYIMGLKFQTRENMVPVLFSFQKRRKQLNGVKKNCFRLLLKKVLILLSSDKCRLIIRVWVKLQSLLSLPFSRFLFQPDWNRMNLKGNYTS